MSDNGARSSVEIRADLSKLDADLTSLRRRLETAMRNLSRVARVAIDVDTRDVEAAQRQLGGLQASLTALGARTVDLDVDADTERALAALTRISSTARLIPDADVEVEASIDRALAALGTLQRAASGLDATIDIDASTDEAVEALAQLELIARNADVEVDVQADLSEALAAIGSLQTAARSLTDAGVTVDVRTAGAIAQVGALQAQLGALRDQPVVVTPAVDTRNLQTLPAAAARAGNDATSAIAREVRRGIPAINAAFAAITVGAVASLAPLAAALAGAAGIGSFAVSSVASIEQVTVAFEGLFGTQRQAEDFVEVLQGFAAETPFQFQQLVGSAQRFLGAFGKDFRDELIPTLTTIGDIVGALGAPAESIDRVTTALLQIKGRGRLASEELLQLREALPGFDPLAGIAKELGVSVPEAMRQLEKGAISGQRGVDLILKSMKEFPGAAGAMVRQSETLNGRISTLKDTVEIAATNAFRPLALSVGTVVDEFSAALVPGGRLDAILVRLGTSLTAVLDNLRPRLIPLAESIAEGFTTLIEGVAPALDELIPAIQDVIPVISDVISRLSQTFAGAGSTLLTGFLPVLSTLATVLGALPVPVLEALVVAITSLKVAQTVVGPLNNLITGVGSIGKLFSPANLAILGVGAALTILTTRAAEAAERQRALDAATRAGTSALVDQAKAALASADELAKLVADPVGQAEAFVVEAVFAALGDGADDAKVRLGQLGLTIEDVDELAASFGRGVNNFDINTSPARSQLDGLRNSLGLTVDEFRLLGDAINAPGNLRDNLVELRDSFDGNSGDNIKLQKQLGLTRDEAVQLSGALKGLSDDQIESLSTLQALTNGFDDVDAVAIYIDAISQLNAELPELGGQLLAQAEANTGFKASTEDASEAAALYAEALRIAGQAATDANEEFQAIRNVTFDSKAFAEGVSNLLEPLNRAKAAVDRLRTSLDLLQGNKIDLTQQQASIEALFDDLDLLRETDGELGAGFGQLTDLGLDAFNIQLAEGRGNINFLIDALTSFQDLAVTAFEVGGDSQFAVDSFTQNIDRLREQFVLAGGDVETFNAQVAALGFDPVQLKVEFDQAAAETLRAEIVKLSAGAPEIAAQLDVLVDEGKYAEAQAALDALGQLDPAVQEVVIDDAQRFGVEAVLRALADEDYVATVQAEVEAGTDERIQRELNDTRYQILVNSDVDTQAIQNTLNNRTFSVRVGTRFVQEAGGFWQRRFEAGGDTGGRGESNIAQTGSHYVAAGDGPRFMYGEPSTRGEYFISMHPAYRERNMQLLADAAKRLGAQMPVAAPTSSITVNPVLQSAPVFVDGGASRMSEAVAELRAVRRAMLAVPPITVQAGTSEEAGSAVYWAHRRRVARFG